jgi:hypothetical protein
VVPGVEDAARAPPAAASEPSPFLDWRRQQKKSRMPIIVAPAPEATPMPALAPVERPLAEFWLVVEPGLLSPVWLGLEPLGTLPVLVKVTRAVTVVKLVVTLVVVMKMLDIRVVVAEIVAVAVDVIVATRLTRRPICWSLSSTKS